MASRIEIVRPFFCFTQLVTLTATATTIPVNKITVSDDTAFRVRHVEVIAWHARGPFIEELAARDKILVNITQANGGAKWFSENTDMFAVKRLCQSTAWRPIILRKGEQIDFEVEHSTDVTTNGTAYNSTPPIKVYFHLIGDKINVVPIK